jgi:hypothetical protein
MISFRLTTEEYGRFRQLCFEQGIASVSEMARVAISMLVREPARVPQQALEHRVSELEGRFHLLSLEIKKLNPSSALDPTEIVNGQPAPNATD